MVSKSHRDAAGIIMQDSKILTTPHEQDLLFLREICSGCRVVQNDYSNSGSSFAYAVFYRIHSQLEAILHSELAINRREVIAKRVLAHVQMTGDLFVCRAALFDDDVDDFTLTRSEARDLRRFW